MAKSSTTKIQLTLSSPPEGMNAIQTFDDQKHFDEWLDQVKDKMPNLQITGNKISFGTVGEIKKIIETKKS